MGKKIITEEGFENIKRTIPTGSYRNVGQRFGVSATTISNINKSENYDEYRELSKGRSPVIEKLFEMRLNQRSGEDLFWRIRTYCRNYSTQKIAEASGLSVEEVKKMRLAPTYKEYLQMDKPETTRYRKYHTWINDGVREVIQQGLDKGIPEYKILNELKISKSTLRRIKNNEHLVNHRMVSRKEYDVIKKDPALVRLKLRQAIENSNSYEDFSVSYYTLGKASWLDDSHTKKLDNSTPTVSEKLTNISSPIKTVIDKEPAIQTNTSHNKLPFKQKIIIWAMILLTIWVITLSITLLKAVGF